MNAMPNNTDKNSSHLSVECFVAAEHSIPLKRPEKLWKRAKTDQCKGEKNRPASRK